MKLRRPHWKDIVIITETTILFLLLFRYWDEVKAFVAGIFM